MRTLNLQELKVTTGGTISETRWDTTVGIVTLVTSTGAITGAMASRLFTPAEAINLGLFGACMGLFVGLTLALNNLLNKFDDIAQRPL